MKIENVERVISKLRAKAAALVKSKEPVSVSVGYTQAYAIHVHENLDAKHPVGQAKFLEQPARELASSGEVTRVVSETVKGGGTLAKGLVMAGLRLQRESQKLVPVDTGALKGSAFTRLDTPGESEAGE